MSVTSDQHGVLRHLEWLHYSYEAARSGRYHEVIRIAHAVDAVVELAMEAMVGSYLNVSSVDPDRVRTVAGVKTYLAETVLGGSVDDQAVSLSWYNQVVTVDGETRKTLIEDALSFFWRWCEEV